LPTGEGILLDPFAGSGSTLAAALAVGYTAIGVETDPKYFALAKEAIPRLASLALVPARGRHRVTDGGGPLLAVASGE